MKQYNIEPIKKALETTKSILILLPQNPNADSVAAGLALYLSFSGAQKNTSIGCPTEMTVEFNRLFGVDKIKPHIGNQNLIITFNYPQNQIEKIAHDQTSDQRLFLTIEPKVGAEPVNPDQVEYSYTGSNADLIFVVGARSLEDLGSIYQQEKALLEAGQNTLVNLSNLDKNTQFGSVNLYDPTAAGVSEISLTLLKTLNLNITSDVATNLLAGIESATNNLANASSADTYETIAELIRLGAKRSHLAVQSPPRPKNTPSSRLTPPSYQPPSSQPSRPFPSPSPSPRPFKPQSTLSQPTPTPPLAQTSQPQPFIPQPTRTQPSPPSQPSTLTPQPQPGWLKPKVLTSSNAKI